MTARNILVLGGTRYFGKHLVERLLANGDCVTVATRGNGEVVAGCAFVKFERGISERFVVDKFWDVVYDQSCYTSDYLLGLEDVIRSCGLYVLTSSQAVYQPGEWIDENSFCYEHIETYRNKINDYGFEKIKSEKAVFDLTQRYIFPRYPVVVGANDYNQRLQTLTQKILTGKMSLPILNPAFQIIDEFDTATSLFDLPFKNFHGAINIAGREIIKADALCHKMAELMQVELSIEYVNDFQFAPFDLIKNETKTLLLEKQMELGIEVKGFEAIISGVIAQQSIK